MEWTRPWSPAWATEIRLGRSPSSPTARERYGDDADWVERWSIYSESMALAKETGGKGGRTEASTEVLERLGSAQTLLYSELDIARCGSGALLGRRLLEEIFLPVLADLFDSAASEGAALRQSVAAWFLRITEKSSRKCDERWVHVTGQNPADPAAKVRDVMWAGGLVKPSRFPAETAEGLRRITLEIDKVITPWLRPGSVPVNTGQDPIDAYLDILLPVDLAERVREMSQRLGSVGGDDGGSATLRHTELMEKALPELARRIPNNDSMLVLGPTSSGKSHVGRIAVSFAVERPSSGRAVVLLPTKALVTQAVSEWKEFLEDTGHAGWRILAGSRDYPQNDEALIRGDFEIAIVIPEKLTGLMANGMRLRGCGVLVVDELQHLSDRERGPRLEMLLTTIRASNPEIPILGLSATLTKESSETIRRWLGIDEEAVVQATRRPVPLDRYACNERRVRGVLDGGEPDDNDELDLDQVLVRWRGNRIVSEALDKIKWLERSIALAVKLLKEGEQSVLCFVGSRDHAERAAEAAAAAMQLERESFPSVGALDRKTPFEGRFWGDLDPETATRLWNEFDRFPLTDLRSRVEDSLRTGVGFHSARLDQELRGVIEGAFRHRHIRLLFATDTLKLGLNLPADAVLIGSMTTPAGDRRQSVLDRDAVAQRLGRAGRLGFTTRGRGYLVVPDRPPKKSTLLIEGPELEGLARLVPAGYSDEPLLERALRAVCDVDAVFTYYLQHDLTGLGTKIEPALDDSWFARLLIQYMSRESPVVTRDGLEQRVEHLFRLSMGAHAGAEAPDAAKILDLLQAHRLIGPSIESPDSLAVTGLGRALSASSLPFGDAAVVEHMAQAALDGAGSLTLLWLAMQSEHVRAGTSWISLQPPEGDDVAADRMKRLLLALARPFVAAPEDRIGYVQELRYQKFYSGWMQRVLHDDIVGRGPDADALRDFVLRPSADPGLPAFNELLRACVMVMWMNGCPLQTMSKTTATNIAISVDHRGDALTRSVLLHEADVRYLGEITSYVFGAAADFLGVRPNGAAFRYLEAIGDSVQIGLPQALTPLARLNLRATHRERLVHLVGALGRDFGSLADLVEDVLTLRRQVNDPEKRRVLRNLTLTEGERAEIRGQLEEMEARRKSRVTRFPGALRSVSVPGIGANFGPVADELSSPDVVGLAGKLATLFEACGVQVVEDEGRLELRSRVDDSRARLVVAEDQLTPAVVAEIGAGVDVIVATGGFSAGVTRIDTNAPAVGAPGPVIVEPAILLEAMARTIKSRGSNFGFDADSDLDDADLFGEFSNILLEGHDDMDAERFGHLTEEDVDDDPGDVLNEIVLGAGLESIGHDLLRLLLSAPPVLGRADLARLVAGFSVAAPPPVVGDVRQS